MSAICLRNQIFTRSFIQLIWALAQMVSKLIEKNWITMSELSTWKLSRYISTICISTRKIHWNWNQRHISGNWKLIENSLRYKETAMCAFIEIVGSLVSTSNNSINSAQQQTRLHRRESIHARQPADFSNVGRYKVHYELLKHGHYGIPGCRLCRWCDIDS